MKINDRNAMKTSIYWVDYLGKQLKTSIFDQLHKKTMPKMKGLMNTMKCALVAIATMCQSRHQRA